MMMLILVEFDNQDWKRREWVRVHDIFQIFLVEHTVIWAEREDPEEPKETVFWPALNFRCIVDRSGCATSKRKPVEFLVDKQIAFVDEKIIKSFQEGEQLQHPTVERFPQVGQAVKNWFDYQDGQKILLTTPTVLVGYRVEVYRAEGTTQWYTAVIQSYNHSTKTLAVTDDTVLEEHHEDPCLIQMRLLDDGVVDSILRGVEIGIGPRRTRQANKDKEKDLTSNSISGQIITTADQNKSGKPQQKPSITEQQKDKNSRSSKQDRKRKSEQIIVETKPDVSTVNKRSRSLETRKNRVNEEVKKDSIKSTAKPANVVSNCKSAKSKAEPISDRITRRQVKDSTVKSPCQTKESKPIKSSKSTKDKTVKPNPTKRDRGLDDCDKTLKNSHIDEEKSISCDITNTNSVQVKEEEKPKTENEESETLIKSEDTEKSISDDIKQSDKNEEENTSSEVTVKLESIKVEECSEDNTTSEEKKQEEDNMHFMKQRLLANNSQANSPSNNLTEKIDVNQSVTDQLTKLAKTQTHSSNSFEHQTSRKSTSPSTKHSEENRYDHVNAFQSPHYNNTEFRSSSRASEHSSGTSEDRRPGSRSDRIKNSPSSSPLVLDKTEPVLPYRDPELMKKNTVHSNVQSMHPKMPAAYPGMPIPPPVSAMPSGSSSYQSSLQRSHLSSLYHPLAQVPAMPSPGMGIDPATYAAIQQQQLLQYQLLLQRTATAYPANLTQQLELLWQQKHPSTPVPPHWALNKNQEELLRDLYALKEREIDRYDIKRREIAERERIEQEHLERLERDKMEREQRERQIERERQDRERIEREKLERERQQEEKDRLERQERQKNEWRREHEREQRVERERILKESADTLAAVDNHFKQSLMLANQKAQWSGPSIVQGTVKPPKSEHHGMDRRQEATKSMEEKIKQEKEQQLRQRHHVTEEQIRQEYLQREMIEREKYLKHVKEASIKQEQKLEKGTKEGKDMYYPGYPTPSSTANIKQEPKFSLFGYQPFQHSYISSEQLQSYGLGDKHRKEEKDSKRSTVSVPPPLIKDSKSHSSVIVDNRMKSSSPRPAHSHHSTVPSTSPRSQPKPAHTPDRQYSSLTSGSPLTSHHQDYMSQSMDLSAHRDKHIHRSHSPLHVADPHQLSAAISQPLDYHRKPRVQSKSPVSSSSVTASIAQPPVTLTGSMAYSYSLIQQGLVPNPIYSQTTVKAASSTNAQEISPGSQGVKRKFNKEGNNRKRQKGENSMPIPSSNNSIPNTTPQILTNHSPYTTTSSNSSSNTISNITSPSNYTAAGSGFMDSFKTFVENAVQNAFFQDPDFNKNKKTTATTTSSSCNKGLSQTPPATSIAPSTGVENQERRKSDPIQLTPMANDEATSLTLSSSTSSLNSQVTLLETINRVANGQLDTDSDTLSAPSPPPNVKSDSSPHKSANHPKLKKAWLQRHSEDKVSTKTSPLLHDENSESSIKSEKSVLNEKGEVVKNCYVNCSYISPSKEGGSKSPISALKLPNGTGKEGDENESTTSASETETQITDGTSGKKRTKTKRLNPKKSKVDSDDSSSSISAPKRKTKKPKDSKEPVIENLTKPSLPQPLQFTSEIEMEVENTEVNVVKEEEPVEIEKPEEPVPVVMETEPEPVKKEKEKKKHKKQNKEQKELKELKEVQKEATLKEVKDIIASVTKPVETNPAGGSNFNKPLVKASIATLKKTCQPFLQAGSCSEVTPKLMKCRECKMTPNQRSKKLPNIFCRFYAFRRLRFSQKGFLTIAGFSELEDAEKDDIDPWLPHTPVMEPKLDLETCKYIAAKVGDKFCELVEQERNAIAEAGEDAKIAWKRAVTGVREMCDVCDTTLFNMHWVCHKCGFVVCLDCYKVKKKQMEREEKGQMEKGQMEPIADDEEQREWLTCSSNRQQHEIDKLMLTQIIPRNALWEVGTLLHEMRAKWNLPATCLCQKAVKFQQKNGINQQLAKQAVEHGKKMVNGTDEHGKSFKGSKKHNGNFKAHSYNPDNSSPLSLLADVASMDSENSRDRSESPYSKVDKYGKSYNPITEPVSPCGGGQGGENEGDKKNPASCSTLRELLTKTAGSKVKSSETKKSKKSGNTLDDIIQSVVEKQLPKDVENNNPIKLLHYIPKFGHSGMIARDAPILKRTLTETSVLYPDVPHSWLCDGRLLRLHDARHKGNIKIFQEQWKRGQPVLVSGVDKLLNQGVWRPSSFSKQFGKIKNDLINTRTGCLLVGHPMSDFWDGFEKLEERLVDETQNPMLLKLKDWPPGDDFSDIMPNHFDDLMQALPLPEYTHRHGKLNLASRLPDFLVRPDLGPKMYNAYGSAYFPAEGTTNLHLDVSDAVNVMVFVGIPDDGPGGKAIHESAALQAIDNAGCDIITKRRVREVYEVPGALWHIFDAIDADKMRDFLNMVGKERGEEIEAEHDPIHDQAWYLDEELRERLYKEYGVLGYTIVQCMGDAIFIPAGAPHQVRNLHSCIKVAEDFVSPEHLNHCVSLTQEFRGLSDTHSNHEDKLQVKNIMYHAVKDSMAVLQEHDPDDDD
ncbi:Hypothetical predicted protein [Mytilus galloprovincialis]|uniref:[histone H3]-dimethyl-L-lysine(9) demethylase n=1 Tax=Mytilus galloprovincialis TaxID=29158 RepID=A0A8B6E5W6_MYTGA|nr:Hypothetical predicted protein [Mytilus galloprovincialis]